MSKVLIAEHDPGLGPMMKARMRLILGSEDIILVEDLTEAINTGKADVKVAVVGHLAPRNGLMAEQFLIDTLKKELPKIVVISCTGREMPGADKNIDRDEDTPVVEEHVKEFLFRAEV